MRLDRLKFTLLTFAILILPIFGNGKSVAQQSEDDFEIYLSFRHRSVLNTVVIAYYKDDKFFLPVIELFDALQIEKSLDAERLLVFGRYLSKQTPYQVDFQNFTATFGDKTLQLDADDMLIKEIDYYLEADLFNEIFGLDFSIEFNNLAMTLISAETLPIVAKLSREQKRQRSSNSAYQRYADYDIVYNRDRKILDGGFLDYNLTNNIIDGNSLTNINSSIGLEALGGDVQGSVIGLLSADNQIWNSQNLRWRFAVMDNPNISQVVLGQTSSNGVLMSNISGIKISNQPLQPRRVFSDYSVTGFTEPGSEVEVYLNNALVDFQIADNTGNYEFLLPLTFGTSVYNFKFFGPTGRQSESTSRIQIPFTFLRPGEVLYNVNIGALDNPIVGSSERGELIQADVGTGVNEWLSVRAGTEYYSAFHDQAPTFTTEVTARVLDSYLVSSEFASNAFLRNNLNVIYANNANLNVSYTRFFSNNGIYNPANATQDFRVSTFYPFMVGRYQLNFRTLARRTERDFLQPINLYRFDLNSRIRRFNIRTGYSNSSIGDSFFRATNQSRIITSVLYNIPSFSNINPIFKGTFFIAQHNYLSRLRRTEFIQFSVAKNISTKGRAQMVVQKNYLGDFFSVGLNAAFNFNRSRVNSSFRSIGSTTSLSQGVRGSIGFDSNNKNFVLTNRDQVGKSALALKLFVDNDNSGDFTEGDQVIRNNALRLDQAGIFSNEIGNIKYITQMQTYLKYNIDVNRSVIENPLIVPEISQFGLISEPNRYEEVLVPFYSAGVIEGEVQRSIDGTFNPIGGLKLIVVGIDKEFVKELRTFSDGSFYDYEIPPGKYEIKVDQSQLDILNVTPNVQKIEFEIEALAEGDFVEGLYFELIPKGARPDSLRDNIGIGVSGVTLPTRPSVDASGTTMAIEYIEANACTYRLQVGAFLTKESAELVASMHQQINPKLIYNKARDLFAVRGGYFQSMSSSTREARFVRSFEYPDVAVVNKCYDGIPPSIYRGDYVYILQFAAYDIASKAQKLASTLNSRYNLGAFMIRDKDNLYKVRMGPFEDVEKARKKKTEIIEDTFINDVYVTKAAMTVAPQINVEFDYIIQVGEFPNTATAQEYADKLQSDFGIRCKIMVDEQETIQLVVDRNYSDWEEVESIRKKIGGTSGYIVPIIQLVERPVVD